MPRNRYSRSLLAGLVLAVVPAAAALVARGTEKPWTPSSPAFRQAGPADAPALLVEFADFQCPHCAFAAPIVRQIEKDYSGRVHIVFKYRPLGFKWSKESAAVAECAGKQGKFWEMYDLLFSKQAEWAGTEDAPKRFDGFAQKLKLDPTTFKQCIADPATSTAIQSDLKDAEDHWVNSTPTFFVNGQRIVGGERLRTIGVNSIERSLRK